jgi:hypothetical protein
LQDAYGGIGCSGGGDDRWKRGAATGLERGAGSRVIPRCSIGVQKRAAGKCNCKEKGRDMKNERNDILFD